MILMQSEVNDRCAVMSEVVAAADAVKQIFPDIPEDLAMVALNYADFMISRPEVATLVGFHWRLGGATQGMNQLPPLAVKTSIKIACNYFPFSCTNP